MKAHLIKTHLLVPRSRSSVKVKVKYISQKMVVGGGGVSVSQTHLVPQCFQNSSSPGLFSHYQTNFRLVQIEINCRRHFKVHLKWKISTIKGRKHCEKRGNCLLQAISPFLTMFSTAIYL